jgi:hypothetical protein
LAFEATFNYSLVIVRIDYHHSKLEGHLAQFKATISTIGWHSRGVDVGSTRLGLLVV